MPNYLHELKTFLASWAKDLRGARDHRNLLDCESAAAIGADIERECEQRRQVAFKARALDDEGLAILDRLTAPASPGGAAIVRAELPDYRRAVRCITRSRELDHALSEAESIASQSPAGAGPFTKPARA